MSSQSREDGKIKKAHREERAASLGKPFCVWSDFLKYIFLTQQFYNDYSHCGEIERKKERPFAQVYIKANGIDFAIPLRSNINHKDYVYWTDKANKCGLDFTKAVVIEDEKYIDTTLKPYIRENEFKALLGKERDIERELLKLITDYSNAKTNPNTRLKKLLLKYSTLQYFEKYCTNES